MSYSTLVTTLNKFFVPALLCKSSVTTALLAWFLSVGQAVAQEPPATPPDDWSAVSINLEEIPYPYPVHFLHRNLYGQAVRIAYMNAEPTGSANGRTVVLLHGSSYYSWYWEHTMAALTEAGYRVVAVDRLGWGRSSKPVIPYSIALHAANVTAVLDHLDVDQVIIGGHSLGGRLASNFAHIYPDRVSHVVMVNPIVLGDSDRGRPWSAPSAGDAEPDLQALYESNLRLERNRIVNWRPEFLEHVRIRYGFALSGEFHRLNLVRSMNSTLMSPAVDTFWPDIQVPTLLIGGAQDGPNYPEVAQRAVDLLPNGSLIMLPDSGHNPHIETPDALHTEILQFLEQNWPSEEGRGDGGSL